MGPRHRARQLRAARRRTTTSCSSAPSWFYEAVSFSEAMKSQTPGVGQAYLGAYTDADGEWLDGGRAYTLHVPADPPAKLFWSATVYDVDTRCLIDNEQQRGDRGSRDPDLQHQRRRLGRPVLRPDRARPARSRTGCRRSPAATGSPTSASTARSSPTSTAAGSSATSHGVSPERRRRSDLLSPRSHRQKDVEQRNGHGDHGRNDAMSIRSSTDPSDPSDAPHSARRRLPPALTLATPSEIPTR